VRDEWCPLGRCLWTGPTLKPEHSPGSGAGSAATTKRVGVVMAPPQRLHKGGLGGVLVRLGSDAKAERHKQRGTDAATEGGVERRRGAIVECGDVKLSQRPSLYSRRLINFAPPPHLCNSSPPPKALAASSVGHPPAPQPPQPQAHTPGCCTKLRSKIPPPPSQIWTTPPPPYTRKCHSQTAPMLHTE
jgi:hypothetical protein